MTAPLFDVDVPAAVVDHSTEDALHEASRRAGLAETEPAPGWQLRANCSTIEPGEADAIFFPRDGLPVPRLAQELCAACPVAQQCLTSALVNRHQEGVWGGVDMRQVNGHVGNRRRRRSAQRREAAA